ncbi:MAG: asparagine synthase-related protein [Planctomycetota bacterium]
MCGFGVILRVTPAGETHEPIPESWLDAIDERIAWRGPDGSGRYRDRVTRADGSTAEVAMVHRRLSIIDHDGGVQPMVGEQGRLRADGTHEGRVAVVFNGCIYNHRELRKELEAKGHTFESDHSDTEVLIHGWREWGERLDEHLDGMYAASIWDARTTTLEFLRDRFGEKPFYVELPGEGTWIATSAFDSGLGARKSEPWRDSLTTWVAFGFGREQPTPSKAVEFRDDESMSEWFDIHNEQSEVSTSLLERLRFAASLVLALPLIFVLLTLWPLIAFMDDRLPSLRAGRAPRADSLDKTLEEAVASRLEADVPIGCFLSGGIDSSLIVHYASKHLDRVTTLTVRMPDDAYDESTHAERVADHLGTDHVSIECDPSTVADDLLRMIRLLGLPFGDSSLLPTYWLCRGAREYVKVALSGDGGDEMFYGYDRYRIADLLYGTNRFLLFLFPTRMLSRRDPKSSSDKLARLLNAASGRGYPDLVSIFQDCDSRSLFGHISGLYELEKAFPNTRGARAWDIEYYLPGDLLRKVDTASMACGLEVRCPFLASPVWNAVEHLPTRVAMLGRNPKALLRSIASRHLPDDIVNRPKQGFAIPIGRWFREDFGGLGTMLMELVGDPARARDGRPFGVVHDVLEFNNAYITRMIDEHWEAGGMRAPSGSVKATPRDHSQRLYMLLVLAIWSRECLGSRDRDDHEHEEHRREGERAE